MDNEELIKQVAHKIDREKALINAANAMRQSSNPQVQQSLDAQIKEGRKNIDYLEERMRELRMRRDQSSEGPRPPAHGGSRDPRAQQGRSGYDQGGYGDPGPGGYQDQMGAGSGMMPPRAPFSPTAPNSAMPKARPNYSKLGNTHSSIKDFILLTLQGRPYQSRYTIPWSPLPAHAFSTYVQT